MRALVAGDPGGLTETNKIIVRVQHMWTALLRLHGPARARRASRLLSDDEVDTPCQAASEVTSTARTAYPEEQPNS